MAARSLQWRGEKVRFGSPGRASCSGELIRERSSDKPMSPIPNSPRICLNSLRTLKTQCSDYASEKTELSGWEMPNQAGGEQEQW